MTVDEERACPQCERTSAAEFFRRCARCGEAVCPDCLHPEEPGLTPTTCAFCVEPQP